RKRTVVGNIGKEMYLYIYKPTRLMLFSAFLLPICYSLNFKYRLMCSLLTNYGNNLPLLLFNSYKLLRPAGSYKLQVGWRFVSRKDAKAQSFTSYELTTDD
ncbi:MAG: hypothetical protein LBS20_08135, partial [Prevotella sp.]|nr:hypothetical protein [Prevotella sp.]